ncbi:T-cell immunomodulatory protein [Contarinia nasturtii]|uniref:T-cell immunomodulatory protein n=1 Tax=Contarinia nasturtii TaxID=265458 RepID=UPI0012D46C78|nr:T-cell immunomodulatory protein [Contarinia nasturtii]
MNSNVKQIISLLLVLTIRQVCASDITSQAFGTISDTIISAFGDFNSDELTDVFVRSTDGRVLEILLASDQEPLLRRSTSTTCTFKDLSITSIVPGDFDGDAYMDLLITSRPKQKPNTTVDPNVLDVYMNWGGSDVLNCTDESAGPLFQMIGEPMALDYNNDMIIDLFGLNENGHRVFWLFNKTRQSPEEIPMIAPDGKNLPKLLVPHSHAYLDLNNDFRADLFLATENGFEIWHGTGNEGFTYTEERRPSGIRNTVYGQSIFLDIELNGNIAQVLPICFDKSCHNSAILAYVNGDYFNLEIDFKDDKNQVWQFITPDPTQKSIYQDTITLRGGDFNLDGYPDMLVTLQNMADGKQIQTFLMENIKCIHCDDKPLTRSFAIKWTAFSPYSNGTVVGAFYDFYQDGILDVIFVKQQANGTSHPVAFRNTLDYDANFVKVMVLTGLTNQNTPTKHTPLGRNRRTYGSNLPGPRIAYSTTRPDGALQASTSAQIPQSGYFALQLPYTVLGLGRTANFVDSLSVGLSGRHRTWTLIIPNSQMVVVPLPITKPSRWKAQLFITPSKLIWMSVISLGATCAVITLIILVLHIKERRQDRLEKLQENQPLHFDAM